MPAIFRYASDRKSTHGCGSRSWIHICISTLWKAPPYPLQNQSHMICPYSRGKRGFTPPSQAEASPEHRKGLPRASLQRLLQRSPIICILGISSYYMRYLGGSTYIYIYMWHGPLCSIWRRVFLFYNHPFKKCFYVLPINSR